MKSKTLNALETYLHHTAIDLLLKAYRDLALEAHGNRDRDRYSYFNTEMRGLDTVAKRLGLTEIEPREEGYFDEEWMSETEHDGKLDDYSVSYVDPIYTVYGPMDGIRIKCHGGPEQADLTYKQALLLLAWLEQEKGRLEGLAKEQVE